MLLKIKNPDQVFLIRGNHEDPTIAYSYGFHHEFHAKFADATKEQCAQCYKKVAKFYDYLPLVLYVGTGTPEKRNYFQCCHGGLEFGYNPGAFLQAPLEKNYQWIEKFNRRTECCNFSPCGVKMPKTSEFQPLILLCTDFVAQSPQMPIPIGFLWHDFVVDPRGKNQFNQGRGFAFNKELTQEVLKVASSDTAQLCGIIRAHQHTTDNNDPMMKLLFSSRGCANLWQEKAESVAIKVTQGMVLTLLLSPDSLAGTPKVCGMPYTGFDYDTSLLVQTGKELNEWTMKVINNQVYAGKVA